MKKLIFLATGCFFLLACNNEKKDDAAMAPATDATAAKATTEVPPSEIMDYKYSDFAKNSLAKLSAGDVTGWVNDYADNAVYVWNNGDSLAGKKAITEYWAKRRSEVIDSVTFTNQIWLPVKVNKPQSVEAPGTWLLGWYLCMAKYKTGKKMVQWMHMDMHLNSDGKIDRSIHYLDRAPINAAMTK